jgi:malate permease and related proteins
MVATIFQLFIIIFAGMIWRVVSPGTLSPEQMRTALSALVFYFLLPALALLVAWTATWQRELFYVSLVAIMAVLVGFALMMGVGRVMRLASSQTGALVLAAAFGNVTYLGLPVLESLFGNWARVVVVQYDLFANTPLLFSLGVYIGVRYGHDSHGVSGIQNFVRLPYLWTALVGLCLNLLDLPPPALVLSLLEKLSAMIAPLMLFAIGLAMRVQEITLKNMMLVAPVALIQLVLVPALVYFPAVGIGLEGQWLQAVILEAAMPVMLLGLVLCDRFQLDAGLYAIAATLSTLVSLLTLPLWQMFLYQ